MVFREWEEKRKEERKPPATLTVKTWQLKLFGYIVRSDPDHEDHVRALNAGPDLGGGDRGPRAPGLPPTGGLPPNPSMFKTP